MLSLKNYLIREETASPKFEVMMHLHPNHPPIVHVVRKALVTEGEGEDDPIHGEAFRSLGEFKPSSLDHDTITHEFHKHLHKHGMYSSAPSHPMVLSPKQYKFKDEFKAKTSKNGRVKHNIVHQDYGSGRLKDYPHPHIGVWSSREPTHLHHMSGGRIHDASKDGHAVVFNDNKVKHRASDDNNRWFIHASDVRKIPKEGLTGHDGKHYGKDIEGYLKTNKPAQSKLRRNVLEFDKKEHGTAKHKEVMDWIKKEHPDFHPDHLTKNVSGKIT